MLRLAAQSQRRMANIEQNELVVLFCTVFLDRLMIKKRGGQCIPPVPRNVMQREREKFGRVISRTVRARNYCVCPSETCEARYPRRERSRIFSYRADGRIHRRTRRILCGLFICSRTAVVDPYGTLCCRRLRLASGWHITGSTKRSLFFFTYTQQLPLFSRHVQSVAPFDVGARCCSIPQIFAQHALCSVGEKFCDNESSSSVVNTSDVHSNNLNK